MEVVLPHILDLDQEGPPRLGQIGLVQTPQIFYNRDILVRLAAEDLLLITPFSDMAAGACLGARCARL